MSMLYYSCILYSTGSVISIPMTRSKAHTKKGRQFNTILRLHASFHLGCAAESFEVWKSEETVSTELLDKLVVIEDYESAFDAVHLIYIP